MPLRGDERGQAIQIGAVLLFGLVIISFATYQAAVVPSQNANVEFDHNQRIQGQLQDLRNGIIGIGGGGNARSLSLPLGTEYPRRIVALNPSSPTGSVRTVGTTDPSVTVSISNASAAGESGDFWTGVPHNYSTGALVYAPEYNEYQRAPRTVYENTVLFNSLNGRNQTLTGQQLVSDNRINLVTLNGTLGTTRSGSLSVDLEPASASTRTISVSNASGRGNVTVTVPTRLDANTWRELLADEFTSERGHVREVRTSPLPETPFQLLHVEFEPGVTYRLQATRVGVGRNVGTPEQAFVTTAAGNGSSVAEGETGELVVEVRDRFNNPVSNVLVNASTRRSSSTVQPRIDTTDEDGQVRLRYEPPDDVDGGPNADEVNVSFRVDPASRSPFDPSTAVNATFSVSIRNTDGSTSGTGRNTGASGTRAYVVNWLDPSGQPGIDCPLGVNNTCELDASQRERVFLTMDTNPTATDASVDYATNGSNAGVVNASAGLTNASGQDTVALFARGEGAIDVFATSGSDGDGATVSITNVPACSPVTRQQFDNGTLPANWDAVAVRNAFDGGVSDATSDSGEYSVFVSGDEGYVRSSTLNTSDCGSVAVEFWLRKGANSFSEPPDGNDVLEVQYRRSNGNWRRFARFDPDDYANGEIIEVSETITAGNAMHDGFQLRWHLTDADAAGFDFWHVDDVFVDGDP